MTRRSKLICAAVAGYALIVGILAARRWACPLPWSQECVATFGGNLETAILFLWVDDWETLFAAAVALLAAGIGAYFLNRQITEARRAENKRRGRRYRAIRAGMPMTLSEVCDWTELLVKQWLYARELAQGEVLDFVIAEEMGGKPRLDPDRLAFPKLPHGVIENLQEMIEASSRPIGSPYVKLLEQIQVRVARARGAEASFKTGESTFGASYINGEIVEVAAVYALASNQFDRARDARVDEQPLGADVHRALNIMQVRDLTHREIHEIVARYYPSQQSKTTA